MLRGASSRNSECKACLSPDKRAREKIGKENRSWAESKKTTELISGEEEVKNKFSLFFASMDVNRSHREAFPI